MSYSTTVTDREQAKFRRVRGVPGETAVAVVNAKGQDLNGMVESLLQEMLIILKDIRLGMALLTETDLASGEAELRD